MNKFKYGVIGFIIGSTCISTVVYGASRVFNVEILPLKYIVDGVEKKLPEGQEGFTYNGRTYVPLRFIAESLGNEVVWDGNAATVYIDKKQPERESAGNAASNQADRFKRGGQMVESGDWVYFIDYTNGYRLYKMKIDGSGRTTLENERVKEVVVDRDWIYYSLDPNGSYPPKYEIYKMKTDGSMKTKITDGMWISSINVVDDTLYYLDNVSTTLQYADVTLYKINTDGTDKVLLKDNNAFILYADKKWIYYCNGSDGHIHKIRIGADYEKPIELNQDQSTHLNIDGEWLYYFNNDDKQIYKMKTDGTGRTPLLSGDSFGLKVKDGWIYYYDNREMSFNLYKMRTDGTENTLIASGVRNLIGFAGDWVYFVDNTGSLYKMKTDGTENK